MLLARTGPDMLAYDFNWQQLFLNILKSPVGSRPVGLSTLSERLSVPSAQPALCFIFSLTSCSELVFG